jgi:hypothetical protein
MISITLINPVNGANPYTDEYAQGFVHVADNLVSIMGTEKGDIMYPLHNVMKIRDDK